MSKATKIVRGCSTTGMVAVQQAAKVAAPTGIKSLLVGIGIKSAPWICAAAPYISIGLTVIYLGSEVIDACMKEEDS